MSIFSGKCDLYDHISGMGGWYTKDGKPTDIGSGEGCLYSDELQDFEAFKKQVHGVIHQYKRIKVNENNRDFAKQHNKYFDFKPIIRNGKPKGFTYTYYGNKYSLKQLNAEGGVSIVIDIHFDTLLDLIPYYPYIVTMMCGDEVFISSKSYVDTEQQEHLQWGWNSDLTSSYKKDLQSHYLDVVREYFLYKIEERTRTIDIKLSDLTPQVDGNYSLYIEEGVDYMHPIKYIFRNGNEHSYWTSPKLLNRHTIILNKADVERCLKDDIDGNNLQLTYVKYCDSFGVNL